jgi:type IV pilus assembly protein PilQ
VRLGGLTDVGAHVQLQPRVMGESVSQFVNLPSVGVNGVNPAQWGVSIFNASKQRLLQLELSALAADGLGRVISHPRVVTADQARATIEQGTELPYQMVSANGVTSVAFRKANLKLEVTPHITPEGSIVMDLDIHKDGVGQVTPAGMAIDTRRVSTQVRVQDGGTVMIGGIYETSEQNETYRVPVLGDLPILGVLFKNERTQRSKQELLVFITPKMLDQTQY